MALIILDRYCIRIHCNSKTFSLVTWFVWLLFHSPEQWYSVKPGAQAKMSWCRQSSSAAASKAGLGLPGSVVECPKAFQCCWLPQSMWFRATQQKWAGLAQWRYVLVNFFLFQYSKQASPRTDHEGGYYCKWNCMSDILLLQKTMLNNHLLISNNNEEHLLLCD